MLWIEIEEAAAHELTFDELAALDGQIVDVGAVVPKREGGGVKLAAVLAAAGIAPDRARDHFATLESADGFSICVPLAGLTDAIVAYRLGAVELPAGKGGPARLYIPGVDKCGLPGVDACAQVKALARIRITATPTAATHQH
jgi:DMSO/TMAO reductase YedYZ molybdopterin-dependent catalytic subunit